ncbi:MAG: threo-3-hydroxy-L-aspartate ammonia-lyase [Nocardioidaceae bacterium]|nr:threo-3-hydroxy-L-aspartate ammonia-lyase [Nocardioidaceae bacterium]
MPGTDPLAYGRGVDTEGLVGLAEIEAAACRISGVVRRTPVVPTSLGTTYTPLLLKAESLQVTGSFKARGATNAVARLSEQDRARGVVTHSSGNHAQALARAAREAGISATVVMPRSTPDVKRLATLRHGARVELVDLSERASRVEQIRAETGAVFVSPFDNADIIAGQGTIGLEILQEVPDLGSVWVPVSGGGLISGIAAALKAKAPRVRVIGVEPELAGDLAEGFAKGERVSWGAERTGRTIADGLRVQSVGELNWRHIEAYVDEVVTVGEDAIRSAMRRIVLECKLVCEPSGAVAVAGFETHRELAGHGTAVAVVSGGNVEPRLLGDLFR